MPQSLDEEIRTLRSHYWSTRDPDGRAFAPLAEAYRRKGDLEEAGSLLRDGLGRLPEFASGHLVAARVCRDREDRVEARDHLDRVLDLDPENVLALLERADLVRAEGDREQAMRDLQTLLELEPDHPDAQSALEALEESALWRSVAEEGSPRDPGEAPPSGTTDVGASTFPELAGTGSAGTSNEIEMAWDADPFGIEEDFGLAGDEPGGLETEHLEARTEGLTSPSAAEGISEPSGIDDGPFEGLTPESEPPEDLDFEERSLQAEEVEVEESALDVEETDPEAGRSEVVEADFEIEEIEVEANAEGGEVTPEPVGDEEDELDGPDRSLFTRTMGEVYARQGFVDRAVDIYSHLLARAPDDEEIASRLAELRTRHPDAGGGSGRAKPVSPDPDSAEPEVASPSEGVRTIGDYFQDLLAWVPGAVPIESLAPDAVPIESLAPDAVEVASLAPDQATVGTTTRPAEAPDAGSGGASPSAESSVVHDDTGARDSSGEGTDDDEDDDDFDEFQSWLESLQS